MASTFVAVLATAGAIVGILPATAFGAGAPAIWSDRPDYAPGETVTLNGSGWAMGEVVHINVNDSAGATWSRDVDVTADFFGNITDRFSLPEWFVATYSVTATGPISGTATTTFTDGNVKAKANPAGTTFTLTKTVYSSSANCTTGGGTPSTVTGVDSAGNTTGVGNSESVKLEAAANSDQGGAFSSWSSSEPFTSVGPRAICVPGFTGGGSRDYMANYAANSPPSVAASKSSVAVNEGQTAANTGTFLDANAADNVTISASVGSVIKTGTNSGTWSWSFGTTDGPDQSQTVTITANDGHGGITTTTFSLTVNNVAPTVTFTSSPTTASEGQTKTYSYSISDPGADTVSSVATSCGANATKSNASSTNTSGSFDCTFPDGPASSTVSAQATDSDGAAGNNAAQAVSIANVAPVVAFTAAPAVANEGQTKSYSYSISDPGQDTVSSVATSCGANGTKSNTSNTDTSGSFDCTFPDGPASSTVSVQATDSDGAAGNTATQAVSVANVAPSVSLSGANAADEGQTKSYGFSVADPGVDSFTIAAGFPDCGDGGTLVSGSESTSATGGSFQCSFPDGPASPAVQIKVEDSDGAASNVDSIAVTVANVAPTATLSPSNDLSVNEGSTHTYSYSISDPGQDTVSAVVTSCSGTGSKVSGSDSFTDSSGSFQCFFADGPNSSTVSAAATDSDGDTGSADTQSVTVNNVAPTVSLTGAATVNEGSTHTYSFTVSDPGQDTFSLSSGYPSCGTGGSYVVDSLSTTTSGGSFDCSFPDGPKTTDVAIKVADSDGASDTDSEDVQVVQVSNLAPVVTAAANQSSDEGASHSFSLGSFSDDGAGDGPWGVVVNWGDGSPASSFSSTAIGSLGSHSHTYADGPATHTVTVTVTDKDGDSGSASFQVDVANVAPTVSLTGANATDEGEAKTYSFSVSDPGADTFTIAAGFPDCGTGGSLIGTSVSTTASGGSFQCSFPDGPASPTVRIKVDDSDGAASNAASVDVSVTNVAPTVGLTGANAADEGETKTYSFSVSDPGTDTFSVASGFPDCGTGGDVVAGSASTTASGGSFQCAFPDGPASPLVRIKVEDSDGAASNVDSIGVTVSNVAPTVSLSGASTANEGQAKMYSFSVSDPGADTFTIAAGFPDCGSGGSLVAGSLATAAPGGSFQCSFPDGPSSPVVRIKVEDADGAASNVDSIGVTVSNVAPTVSLTGVNLADEGQTKTYSFSVSDPGQDTFTIAAGFPDCGSGGSLVSGSESTSATGGSFQCSFPDGPASPNVQVKVSDSDGADSNLDSIAVTVSNVAPTVTIDGAANVNEGSTHTYSFAVTDPGQDTFAVSSGYPTCGTAGSYVGGSLSTNAGGGSFDCKFPDGPATTSVAIRVADSDGASETASEAVKIVEVANVAPSVTAPADQASDEGDLHSFSLGSFSDDGVDDSPWSVSIDWGDGSPATTFSVTSMGSLGSRSHTYGDGPATHTVTVTVKDKDNEVGSATFEVSVANVAPTVAFTSAPASANEGETKTYSYSISDPGNDTVASVATSCGANGTKSNASNDDSSGSFDCTFPDGPASSTVSVQATDSDGAAGNTATQAVSVANVAPSVSLSGANAAHEGQTKSYSFSVADPGVDSFTIAAGFPDCGSGGDLVSGSVSTNASGGSFQCSFPDGPASPTVRIRVDDSDGAASTVDSIEVSVSNVAPTVTMAGPANVNEGSTHTYSFTVTDPGQDTFAVSSGYPSCGTGGSYVAGSLTTTASGGSFDCRFPDGPKTTDVAIKVADSDGASDTDSEAVQVVEVDNLNPVVTAPADQSSDEGDSHAFNLGSFSDNGESDSPWHVTVTWGDGSAATEFDVSSTGPLGSKTHSYADGPATHTVTVTVIDKDGGSDSKSFQVSVRNVAPTVAFTTAPSSANEGQTKTYTYTISDPGNDTIASVATSCGANGVKSNASSTNTSGSFDCTFPDGPASSTVSAQATDSDGEAGNTATQSVTVANVGPIADITAGATSAYENETKTYSFSVTDPGDDTYAVSVGYPDCGTGGSLVSGSYSVSGNTSSQAGSFDCKFPDGPASPNVRIRFTDSDGEAGNIASRSVTVANVAPTATFNAPSSVDEGQNINVSLTDPNDPSAADMSAAFTYAFDCGSGYGAYSTTNSASCPTTDNGTRTVKGKIRDKDGGETEYTKTVSVGNVAPQVTIVSPTFGQLYAKPANVPLTASFTDSGTGDTHTCTINWDDGTTENGNVTETEGSGTCSKTHAYNTAGVYTIRVTVTDDDGASGIAEVMIVVYDPSAGFVTGGGWIDVAAGSYRADPTLAGRANFGFTSKYKNGAQTPTGETEFNFQVANFKFHSANYQWLVVSGFKAQYKGTGSVNGVSGYDFRLTAYDGDLMNPKGPDRFRIKITKGGAVVFDNRFEKPDDIDQADPQAISAGSIVIHKP